MEKTLQIHLQLYHKTLASNSAASTHLGACKPLSIHLTHNSRLALSTKPPGSGTVVFAFWMLWMLWQLSRTSMSPSDSSRHRILQELPSEIPRFG